MRTVFSRAVLKNIAEAGGGFRSPTLFGKYPADICNAANDPEAVAKIVELTGQQPTPPPPRIAALDGDPIFELGTRLGIAADRLVTTVVDRMVGGRPSRAAAGRPRDEDIGNFIDDIAGILHDMFDGRAKAATGSDVDSRARDFAKACFEATRSLIESGEISVQHQGKPHEAAREYLLAKLSIGPEAIGVRLSKSTYRSWVNAFEDYVDL